MKNDIPQSLLELYPSTNQYFVDTFKHCASGLNRIRTLHQVHLACARGYSRPVIESHIATLMSRGAGEWRYKGLDGAVVQMGMIVMAHNGATLVRIRQQRLSKRGRKFRRLLGLRHRNNNQINDS